MTIMQHATGLALGTLRDLRKLAVLEEESDDVQALIQSAIDNLHSAERHMTPALEPLPFHDCPKCAAKERADG